MIAYFDATDRPIYFDDDFDFELIRDKWGLSGHFYATWSNVGIIGTSGNLHIDYTEAVDGVPASISIDETVLIKSIDVGLWNGAWDGVDGSKQSLYKFVFSTEASNKTGVIQSNYNILNDDLMTFDEATTDSGTLWTWAQIFADMPVTFNMVNVTVPSLDPVNVQIEGMEVRRFIELLEIRYGWFFIYDYANTEYVAYPPATATAANTALLEANKGAALNTDGSYVRTDPFYKFVMPQENNGFIGDVDFRFNTNQTSDDDELIAQSLGTFGGERASVFMPWIVADYYSGSIQNQAALDAYVADAYPRLANLFDPPTDYHLYGRFIDFEVDGFLQKIVLSMRGGIPYTETVTQPYDRTLIDEIIPAAGIKSCGADLHDIYKRPFVFGRVQTEVRGNQSSVSIKRCEADGTLISEFPNVVDILLRSTSLLANAQYTELFIDDVVLWVPWDNLQTEGIALGGPSYAGVFIGGPDNFKNQNPVAILTPLVATGWNRLVQPAGQFGVDVTRLMNISFAGTQVTKIFETSKYDSEGKLEQVTTSTVVEAWPFATVTGETDGHVHTI